jgi:hypothetical protein
MCRGILLLIVALLPTSSVRAAVFAESSRIEGVSYPKMGEHRATYKMFFKLYDAALFTVAGATAEEVLTRNCSFRLEFRYLRSISKATILQSANHMLAKNLSAEDLSRITAATEQLHATYRSVQTGDVSSLTYIAGRGTTFAINGEQLITISSKEFAQHYLQIWLGERPVSRRLRDRLLGK